MEPKLFYTGFLQNDSKLRQKQGLPIQNFGGLCYDKNVDCNKKTMYPIPPVSLNYGKGCPCDIPNLDIK